MEGTNQYEIIQMNENTWRIEDGGVRFFLLTGTDKALLIDSGMNVHNAKEIAGSLTELPILLLNTHADRDHVGSNGEFEEFYMHPAEAGNLARAGVTGKILPITDGDELDLGGRPLRIIHLPGHTPGSIAVLDVKGRFLISGDPIQEHGRIFMFGEHRNLKDYAESLERLEKRIGEFDEIWPSHSDIPIAPGVIGKLIDGAKKIHNGEITGTETEFFGNKIMVYDLGFTVILGECS